MTTPKAPSGKLPSDEKIYFSKTLSWNFKDDDKDTGILNFVIVPNRWWSIREWKLAMSLRGEFINRMMTVYNEANLKHEEGK